MSKDAVSVTAAKKGNRPVMASSVEMEDALNDGQAVESAKDTQLWAMAAGMLLMSSARTAKCRIFLRFSRRGEGEARGNIDVGTGIRSASRNDMVSDW